MTALIRKLADSESYQRERALQFLYAADMNLALEALEESNLGRTRELLKRHRPAPGQPDLRGWEWRYLWRLSQGDQTATLGQTRGMASALTFTADGKRVVSATEQGDLDWWEVAKRQGQARLSGGTNFSVVTFDPPRTMGAWASYSGTIHLFNLDTGQQLTSFGEESEPVAKLALAPDGMTIAAFGIDGVARIWSIAEKRLVARHLISPPFHGTAGAALAFAPDGQTLACGLEDGTVKLVDPKTGMVNQVLSNQRKAVAALAFSPDGRLLASAGWDGTARVWETRSEQQVAKFAALHAWVISVLFSPDGRYLAASSADQYLASYQPLMTIKGHTNYLFAAAFADDDLLMTSDMDGQLSLWRAASRGEIGTGE